MMYYNDVLQYFYRKNNCTYTRYYFLGSFHEFETAVTSITSSQFVYYAPLIGYY